jgi:hypothetical protein
MIIDRKRVIVSGGIVKIIKLAEEWYEDIEDANSFMIEIRKANVKADIFTFWQRMPETKPKYAYYRENESIAVLPIKGFNYWWNEQISAKTRNMVRKAEKNGVVIRETKFDDEFIRGLVEIFNESPYRQGKPFWHYGKDFETIKKQFANNIHREEIIGAYYDDRLIGFIMLAIAEKYAMTTQILSMMRHRDKAPTNALLARAVQICDAKNIPFLIYAMWSNKTLGSFKVHNGFERIDLPRYYIPLTIKGSIVLKLKLHHGAKEMVPGNIREMLLKIRRKWYMKVINGYGTDRAKAKDKEV